MSSNQMCSLARRAALASVLGVLIIGSACASSAGRVEETAAGDVVRTPGTPGMRMSAAEMFTDPAIAATASVSNQSEIIPSRLALQKSQHAQVRAIAQRMIDEHTRFETQMQQMLQAKGVTPVHNAFSYQLEQNLQPMMRELESTNGSQFDQLYVDHLVASHMTTLHALETTLIPNARDAEMRAMLEQQVRPAVARHYAEVLQLQTELLRGSSGAGSER